MAPQTANVFELDPGLARLLRTPRGEEMRARGRVIVLRLPRGPVDFTWLSRVRGYGLMVLEGYFTRQVRLAERSSMELLGRGDVLRPWDEPHSSGPVPVEATWRAVTETSIAVLDTRFMVAMSPFPEVTEALTARLLMRSRWSSLLLLLSRLSWTEARILVLFWHMAERWGRALPDGGVTLPVNLTHAQIGELVSAQRPTVTMALNHLIRMGAVTRTDDGWLLHGDPPSAEALEREAMTARFRGRRKPRGTHAVAAAQLPATGRA